MRGDPPLIGGAKAQAAIIGDRGIRGKQRPRCALRPACPCTVAIIRRTAFADSDIDIRQKVRASRRVVIVAAGIVVAAAAALAVFLPVPVIDPPGPLATPEHAKELVVLIRPGPAVYFPGPDGRFDGLDAELLRRYAAEKKLPLRFVAIDDADSLLTMLGNGDGHVGAGGLLRPPPGANVDAAPMRWTSGYFAVEPVLIYNTDGFKPANLGELDGETVAFSEATGQVPELEAARAAHPGIRWQAH